MRTCSWDWFCYQPAGGNRVAGEQADPGLPQPSIRAHGAQQRADLHRIVADLVRAKGP